MLMRSILSCRSASLESKVSYFIHAALKYHDPAFVDVVCRILRAGFARQGTRTPQKMICWRLQ